MLSNRRGPTRAMLAVVFICFVVMEQLSAAGELPRTRSRRLAAFRSDLGRKRGLTAAAAGDVGSDDWVPQTERRSSSFRSDLGKRSMAFRSDLGKRQSYSFSLRSDVGNRHGDEAAAAGADHVDKRLAFRSDLGKRPAFRSDLGKRAYAPAKKVSSFRSDLGKRPMAFRSDLGKRSAAAAAGGAAGCNGDEAGRSWTSSIPKDEQ